MKLRLRCSNLASDNKIATDSVIGGIEIILEVLPSKSAILALSIAIHLPALNICDNEKI
jgi:hypothetical protein